MKFSPQGFGKGMDTAKLRTLVYARESRDDNGQYYERIETQRDQLVRFCEKSGLTNFVRAPIMDDNKSGTNFERLADVTAMMERGEVDVIVFKDSARLGRNQLETLKFMETARKTNVQIVFSNEGYDPDFFPLTAWFNERRAKDDSIKIRGVMLHRMQAGELIVKPSYGYTKLGKRLVIDEGCAQVVRMIYAMYLEGHGTRAIAALLNARGLPTPSQVKGGNAPAANTWNQFHVLRILRNEQYMGTMIHLKYQKKSFLDKSAKPVPKEDRIVIENHHEAIISPQDWARANQSSRTRAPASRVATPFSGLLRCGRCGSTLVHVAQKQRLKESYVCAKYQKEGAVKDDIRPGYGCRAHRVNIKELVEATAALIMHMLGGEGELERLADEARREQAGQSSAQSLSREIRRVNSALEQMYGHLLEGLIDEELYRKKREEYSQRLRELEQERASLSDACAQPPDRETLANALMEPGALDNAALRGCFERIIRYLPGEIDEAAIPMLGLGGEEFEIIKNNGGILFILS